LYLKLSQIYVKIFDFIYRNKIKCFCFFRKNIVPLCYQFFKQRIMQTVTLRHDVLNAYQKMFGKRKDNKYTENEVFIFNSKLNASKTFAKYL